MEDDFEFDALFDQIGDNQNSQRAQWVNGEFSINNLFILNGSIYFG